MANLKVNTEAAITAANNIKLCNAQMRDSFPDVQRAIDQLNNNWDGAASNNAMRKFDDIKSKFSDSRFKALDNYVKFLLQQVGEGYTQTEEVNVSLADQFK